MTRRRRKSVVFIAGDDHASDLPAQAVAKSLGEVGYDILYLGRESDVGRIASSVVDARADTVEACLAGGGALVLLRDLLRELHRVDRQHVGIVVHKMR